MSKSLSTLVSSLIVGGVTSLNSTLLNKTTSDQSNFDSNDDFAARLGAIAGVAGSLAICLFTMLLCNQCNNSVYPDADPESEATSSQIEVIGEMTAP